MRMPFIAVLVIAALTALPAAAATISFDGLVTSAINWPGTEEDGAFALEITFAADPGQDSVDNPGITSLNDALIAGQFSFGTVETTLDPRGDNLFYIFNNEDPASFANDFIAVRGDFVDTTAQYRLTVIASDIDRSLLLSPDYLDALEALSEFDFINWFATGPGGSRVSGVITGVTMDTGGGRVADGPTGGLFGAGSGSGSTGGGTAGQQSSGRQIAAAVPVPPTTLLIIAGLIALCSGCVQARRGGGAGVDPT